MKIAIISTMGGFPWGGSEALWSDLAFTSVQEGHKVLASVYEWPETPSKILELQQRGIQISKRPFCIPQRRSISGSFYALLKHRRLKVEHTNPFQDVFMFNPDVICISQGGTYDIADLDSLLQPLSKACIPYVVICHSNNEGFVPERIVREKTVKFFAAATHVAFMSDRTKQITERQLAQGIDNSIILRNPVNLSDYGVVPWPASAVVQMANVASLTAVWKSQDILFETLSSPLWRTRNWRLHLCGDGPDRNYLESLSRYYNITDRVRFLGHVKDIRALWAENQLLVFPSRVEGAPSAALVEAMLCGRPSVATDVGGITEWIDEGETGFIAEAATARSFGAALERALLARSEWWNIGIRAHQVAISKIDSTPGKTLLNILSTYSNKH